MQESIDLMIEFVDEYQKIISKKTNKYLKDFMYTPSWEEKKLMKRYDSSVKYDLKELKMIQKRIIQKTVNKIIASSDDSLKRDKKIAKTEEDFINAIEAFFRKYKGSLPVDIDCEDELISNIEQSFSSSIRQGQLKRALDSLE